MIPRNPLDVLAQQIVAICADEEISVDELHELVRGAYPFADLSRAQLENVLDMLAGRYPSDEFAELRPRIVWDRTAGVIRGRPGSRAAGRHERGHDPRSRPLRRPPRRRRRTRRRARRGDGLRGARGPDLPARRLDLADRGDHARPRARLAGSGRARCGPVLEGRGGRPAVRTWTRRSASFRAKLRVGAVQTRPRRLSVQGLDSTARRAELVAVPARPAGRDGRRPFGPDRRGRALSRRDRRLARLHPHAVRRPRARAVGARDSRRGCATRSVSRCSRSGRTTESRSTFRTPTRRRRPTICSSRPTSSRTSSSQEVGQSALFGARFRENAARALLIPRRRPGERTPLWQQRLKAQSLLQVARRYGSFPIVLETYRECLQDVFDLPALKRLLQGLRTREIDLVEVETGSRVAVRRARCSSTTSRPTCTRTTRRPRSGARRRSRSTATCCASCSARRSCATCSIPTRVADVERAARGPSRATRTSCTTCCACAATCVRGEFDAAHAAALEAERRAYRARIAGGGAADRRRGRGPLPRRARRDAAGRPARRLPRAG